MCVCVSECVRSSGVRACVRVCVCERGREGGRDRQAETMTERDRDRETETDRETDTHTHTDRGREGGRDRQAETMTERDRDRETETDRETDTHTHTHTHTDRDRHRQTDRQTKKDEEEETNRKTKKSGRLPFHHPNVAQLSNHVYKILSSTTALTSIIHHMTYDGAGEGRALATHRGAIVSTCPPVAIQQGAERAVLVNVFSANRKNSRQSLDRRRKGEGEERSFR